jgi:UDP-2-acetamido-3-amino-2,3-dideoxy-glucuronate N-acetyltransferase
VFDYSLHPQALVETTSVGTGTRIWAFAHVLPGAVIGADCNICDHVFIENDVRVGDRVTIKSGVQLWDGVSVDDDAFIGPNVTFSNDSFPRSRQRPSSFLKTVIRKGASIGANATILPGLTIGEGAMVGAGAVVTHNVPAGAIVSGNPAVIRGYVGTDRTKRVEVVRAGTEQQCSVRGVRLIPLDRHEDLRGHLAVAQRGGALPFEPQRVFFVHHVPSREVRGAHAHRRLQQLLICAAGQCSVVLDDGRQRQEFPLDGPDFALLVPALVWGIQYRFSADATLVVLASEAYDDAEYIRDYDEFLQIVGKA